MLGAKTIWLYREQPTRADALAIPFARFDAMLAERGLLAMGGQIVDTAVVDGGISLFGRRGGIPTTILGLAAQGRALRDGARGDRQHHAAK